MLRVRTNFAQGSRRHFSFEKNSKFKIDYAPSCMYSKHNDMWCQVDGNFGFVGVTHISICTLAKLRSIKLQKQIGEFVTSTSPFGYLDTEKSHWDLESPVSGTIVEMNSDLLLDLEVLRSDPYQKGWILKILIDHKAFKHEKNHLKNAAEHFKSIQDHLAQEKHVHK